MLSIFTFAAKLVFGSDLAITINFRKAHISKTYRILYNKEDKLPLYVVKWIGMGGITR